ncbi:hypothetical protein [Streptomyces sp. NPDC101249]|uniref:hypothetical protein n=1 Tax=Streptomyces sp. NPDC101249 TaxID=3366140 RepID=UPI00380F8C1B
MPTCLALGAPDAGRSRDRSAPDDRSRTAIFYEDLVLPTCEELGLTLLRADGLRGAGLPTERLLDLVTEADVVVVDLDGFEKELSFGLGMRHALGRCTVHVTAGTETPPGSGQSPAVVLPPRPDGAAVARRQLASALARALGGAALGAVPTEQAGRTVQVPAPGQEESAPGVFDLVAEAEAQLEALDVDMADVESALTDLGAMMELVTEDMARVDHPGASMQTRLAVVNRLGRAIDGPAGDLEKAAERFAERMKAASTGFGAVLDWTAAMPREEWPDGLEAVLDDVIKTASDLRHDTAGFQEVLTVMNLFGASSRHLRVPARRISTSLRTIFGSVTMLEEWQGRALALRA